MDRETRDFRMSFSGVTGQEEEEEEGGDGRKQFGNFRFDTSSKVSPENTEIETKIYPVFF